MQLQSAEGEKAAFYAIWDAFNHDQRCVLIRYLSILVDAMEAEEQELRAALFPAMQRMLLSSHDASTELATKVSHFVTLLSGLSVQAIGEMLSMTGTRPTEFVVQKSNDHASESEGISDLTEHSSSIAAARIVESDGVACSSTTGTRTTAPSTVDSESVAHS